MVAIYAQYLKIHVMSRRASYQAKPLWFFAVSILIVMAAAAGNYLFQQVKDPYRTVQELGVSSYMDNANSLRGNVYKIEGVVQNSLAWSPAKGRLFSVEVGESRDAGFVPVLVPSELNHLNIQKGQRFRMKVEVIENGVLKVLDLQKS